LRCVVNPGNASRVEKRGEEYAAQHVQRGQPQANLDDVLQHEVRDLTRMRGQMHLRFSRNLA
jgi:hypothetical protein